VLNDGSVWAWGDGNYGQLGQGQTGGSYVPVAVSTPAAWNGHSVVRVVAGTDHNLALLDDGSVWAWGYGGNGQLGNGQTGNSSVPAAVSAPAEWTGHTVVSVAAGGANSLVLLSASNSAPTVANPLADQSATYGTPFTFAVPANTFSDSDTGQTLSYSASGLPAWLAFDAEVGTFSGTPTAVGTFAITVTATDDGSPPLSVSTPFNLVVSKAPLTARGATLYRFYGEENPPLPGTIEGVVNGDLNLSDRQRSGCENTQRHAAERGLYAAVQTGGDVAVAAVQVVNADGQVSNPLGFSIVPSTVGTADAAVAPPGTATSVSTAPTTPGEPGVSVTVSRTSRPRSSGRRTSKEMGITLPP